MRVDPAYLLRRRLAAAALVVALAAGLTGCVDPDTAPALPTGTPPATSGPVVTPTIDPTPGATPLGVACADLVDPDAVYALNPNLALVGDGNPEAGSAGARALAAGGVSCHWVLESGGGAMDVSAARLGPADLATREAEAAAGTAVAGLGDRAYFSASGIPTVTVFRGDVWLVVASEQFGQGADAAGIVDSALASIAAG